MALQGRIALISGGGSGIGRATAVRLAQEGADVGVLDLDLEAARGTVDQLEQLGRRGAAVRADVTKSDEVRAAVAEAESALGPISVLVNNAGVAWSTTLVDMAEQDWDRMLGIHVKGAFNCTKAVLPGMLARGWAGSSICPRWRV